MAKLDREKEGAVFGELALVYSIPRTATVKATTDVEVYVLEKPDFEEVRAASPQLEIAVQKTAREHFARFQFCLFELAHTPETEPFRPDQVCL
jgi:CRP-like cAMP-binding protein